MQMPGEISKNGMEGHSSPFRICIASKTRGHKNVEPIATVDQHPSNPDVPDGRGDDDGEAPHSLGTLGVVSSTEGDWGFRPPQWQTCFQRRCGCADITLEELKPPA